MTTNYFMQFGLISVFAAMSLLISSNAFAQPPTHPGAEKAMAKLALEKDFGDNIKFHSRQVVTIADNDKVPGLNGLMFMKWKGDNPATEVMASVQWFEKKADLLKFYASSTDRDDYKLSQFEKTTLWKVGEFGYSWTDGEHFLVSLGPPPEMVRTFLAMIGSKVADLEKEADKEKSEKESEKKVVPE